MAHQGVSNWPTTEMPRRRHIYLSDRADGVLEGLCEETGQSLSAVIADAAEFYRWMRATRAQGARLIVERDGRQREVISL